MEWKRFGYNGIALEIPSAWDPTRCLGDSRRGLLALDDGAAPQLIVEWGSSARLELSAWEEKLLKKHGHLPGRARHILAPDCHLLLLPVGDRQVGLILALQRQFDRFVCLRLLNPPADATAFCRRLAAPLAEASDHEQWRFFAVAFDLPRGFILQDAYLGAGHCRLFFARQGRRLAIWDFALLAEMEKIRPLSAWARRAVEEAFPRRFAFDAPAALDADFAVAGHLRWRWRLLPSYFWHRASLIHWQGIANRSADRYAVVLYQYRSPEDLAWLGRLARSLAEPRQAPPTCRQPLVPTAPQPAGFWQKLTNTAFGEETSFDRSRSLAAIPVPIAGLVSEEAPDNRGRVLYVPRRRFFRGWLGKQLERGAAPMRFFLDRLGNAVWTAIDGRRSVKDICEDFRSRFGLHPREAESMVVAFINSLLRRGVLTLHLPARESGESE